MVSESPSGQSQAPCGPPTAGVATDAVRGRAPGDAGPAPAKADLSSAGQVGARAPEALGLAPRNSIGALFSYVVATDSGFAPNPFFGLCTLACCKPAIRRAVGARLLRESGYADLRELRSAEPGFVRAQNLWVIGLAGASLPDRLRRSVVYVMQVTDVLDHESYFEEHPEKRPRRGRGVTSADARWHGDAIYTGNDPATAHQVVPCTHSDGDREDANNMRHDLGGRYVLASDHFIYFGTDAPYIPLEQKLHHGRGHSSNHSSEAIRELEALLNGSWAGLFNEASGRRATPAVNDRTARACRGVR